MKIRFVEMPLVIGFFEYSEGELAKEQLIHNVMNFLI